MAANQTAQIDLIENELSNIRTILDIDSAFRTQDHCQTIINFLKQGKYLQQGGIATDDLSEFARQLYKKTYQENENIFKQGDMGDEYFIILKGKVMGYINDDENNEKHIFTYGIGRDFGEIAILEDKPRSATIRAATETECLVIKKDTYKRFCGRQRNQYIKEVREFFEENELMKSLSHEAKSLFAKRSFPKKFQANKTIVCQGDRADNLYFISKGGVKVIRKIKKKTLKNIELSDEYKKEFQLIPPEISLDVQTLYKGSQFAEYEFLKGIPLKNEVVTVIPTLLISINRSHLNEVPPEDEQLMLNNTDVPQSDEDIMQIYLENKFWKRYKQIVVKNVITHKFQSDHAKKFLTREEELRKIETDPYFNFLYQNGCYVFSGPGINFPELIKPITSPYNRELDENIVAFGTKYTSLKEKRRNFNLTTKGSFTQRNQSPKKLTSSQSQTIKMPPIANAKSKIAQLWKKKPDPSNQT